MYIIINKLNPDWLFIKSDEYGKPIKLESIDDAILEYYEVAIEIKDI